MLVLIVVVSWNDVLRAGDAGNAVKVAMRGRIETKHSSGTKAGCSWSRTGSHAVEGASCLMARDNTRP